jgi:hypothetical protein
MLNNFPNPHPAHTPVMSSEVGTSGAQNKFRGMFQLRAT